MVKIVLKKLFLAHHLTMDPIIKKNLAALIRKFYPRRLKSEFVFFVAGWKFYISQKSGIWSIVSSAQFNIITINLKI